MRFHTCYSIDMGPRVHDMPLKDIVDIMLKVNAGAYSFEASNPRHEHEYHVWEDVQLPEGKVLIPGVITHTTNLVEHPELIAERIVRYARARRAGERHRRRRLRLLVAGAARAGDPPECRVGEVRGAGRGRAPGNKGTLGLSHPCLTAGSISQKFTWHRRPIARSLVAYAWLTHLRRRSNMLSREENELICRTDPGTPMGELFRRFWFPVALAEEIPGPDCDPVRVQVLGEHLVLFRDTQGHPGLVDAYCPHRGAPLFFGRNEECGLRCVYHGWKFDVHGNCVEMPNVPEGEYFKAKVTLQAYSVVEAGICSGRTWDQQTKSPRCQGSIG